MILTCPVYFETRIVTEFVNSVHSYVFTFKSDNQIVRKICSEDGLVCHGLDINYHLGHILLKSENYSDIDYEQAIQATDLIGIFSRNEKLTVQRKNGNVDWIKFENETKTSLEINHLNGNHFVNDYRGDKCNLLEKYIVK